VAASRKKSANFHSRKCYQQHQHKRRGVTVDLTAPGQLEMIGRTFGRLTVTRYVAGRYACTCSCGGSTRCTKKNLLVGQVKSCGCYNREKARKDGAAAAWAFVIRILHTQARRRGLSVTLTDLQIIEIGQRSCHYCGAPPREWAGAKKQYLASCANKNLCPDLAFADSKIVALNGIDRVDPSWGYERHNVVACCETCNKAKLAMSVDQFITWIRKVHQHTKSW
jgi:hypothetical protein